MSGTVDARLIRCPNCEKLLPEVTHFSVYECGSCGAVLKAKNKDVDLDTFSVKSDEESVGETVENLADRYEKMVNVSETERRKIDSENDVSENDMRSSISSSSRAQRKILRDSAENKRAMASLASEEERWDVEVEVIRDIKRSVELQQVKIFQGLEEDVMMYQENEDVGLRRAAGRMLEGQNGKKSEVEGFMRARRRDAMLMEGAPSDLLRSRFDYDDEIPARKGKNVDEIGDVDCIGEDRAELLRQLDVLKDKLSRSGNLIEKGKGKIPPQDRRRIAPRDPYVSEDWYPDASLEYPDRPSYQNHYAEPPPLMRKQEMGSHYFYPPHYAPIHIQRYEDPSRSQMHRRDPRQAPAYYQTSPTRAYHSGPYRDDGKVCTDAVEPYPVNYGRHRPTCSCYQCLNRSQVPAPILPTAYGDKYSDMFSYNDNAGSFGSRDNNHRLSDRHPLRSRNSRTRGSWHSDVDSEVGDYINCRPPRVHLASVGKRCRPVAGGAPFLICFNCSELLLLSNKVLNKKHRNKMRCGSCSTLIVLAISKNSLAVSTAKDNPLKVESKTAGVLLGNADGHQNQVRTTFSSDDYDNSDYDFHYMDREPVQQVSTGQEIVNVPIKMKIHHSTSKYACETEEDWECSAAAKYSSLVDHPTKSQEHPPPILQDHLEYSNKNLKDGNLSGHSEHVEILANKTNTRQFSRKESSATEIDLSSNEFNNTGTTLDSGEASRGRDDLKANRAAKSFIAGIVEESYKDSDRSNESLDEAKASVTVNGHLIPDRMIKKAQRLAGPIDPGNYWYDFRAGFWGAIGGPCLGIIPPFIEELNYPMPEHCGGGNTSVFVNGRELNQKDLNLLAVRGLPREKERSYIIEISGRVLDEHTGEELESLGKLAPTVERMKRGFGMRAPKAAPA